MIDKQDISQKCRVCGNAYETVVPVEQFVQTIHPAEPCRRTCRMIVEGSQTGMDRMVCYEFLCWSLLVVGFCLF